MATKENLAFLLSPFQAYGLIAVLAINLLLASAHGDTNLYYQNFNSFPTSSADSTGWYLPVPNPSLSPGSESLSIQPVGVAGSQGLFYEVDASSANANPYYWLSEVLDENVAPNLLGQPLANSTLSLDIAVSGAINNTPLYGLYIGNMDWFVKWSPTLSIDGSFTHFSTTLDTGQLFGTYDPAGGGGPLALFYIVDANGFGLDANNQVTIDNVSLDVVPEPSSEKLILIAFLLIFIGCKRRLCCMSRFLPNIR
jgi:hypothetical protein